MSLITLEFSLTSEVEKLGIGNGRERKKQRNWKDKETERKECGEEECGERQEGQLQCWFQN